MKVEIDPARLHQLTDWDATIDRLVRHHERELAVLRRARDGSWVQVREAWQLFIERPELLFGAPATDEE